MLISFFSSLASSASFTQCRHGQARGRPRIGRPAFEMWSNELGARKQKHFSEGSAINPIYSCSRKPAICFPIVSLCWEEVGTWKTPPPPQHPPIRERGEVRYFMSSYVEVSIVI
ncbi:hypothetical protein CEXT_505691 [Caerostris extrusa]|uniref:Secreted protein n=1 Tax=Caerostris extrusa TaxID=172846 RepID=A0AAV4MNA2_CAEEX|nr:hypothetical protein CEXT_505691 [Caerostris extrusa]